MIQSYFFIPGNHPKLLEKIKTIEADYLILDIEDSILQKDLIDVLNRIIQIPDKGKLYVRPRIFDQIDKNSSIFKTLLKSGYQNFFIPKFRNINNIKYLENIINELQLINVNIVLLVENPEALFSLKNIINNSSLNISGIAFGSHDYCNETGMAHKYELLKFPRFIVAGIAKMFGIKAIDIVCIDITNDDAFLNEIQEAKDMGFDAKFIIHPKQLKLLNEFKYYTINEINEAESILKEFNRLGRPAIFKYKEKVIEPPHISNYEKIINWKTKYDNK